MSGTYEVKLPVSGKKIGLRRATLRDERLADMKYNVPAGGSDAARQEAVDRAGEKPWALVAGCIKTVNGEPANWVVDDLFELPSADATALLLFYRGLNQLNEKAVGEIQDFFSRPAGSEKHSLELS